MAPTICIGGYMSRKLETKPRKPRKNAEEWRRNHSAFMKGKKYHITPHSEETKRQLSDKKKGIKSTPEDIEARRIGILAYWATPEGKEKARILANARRRPLEERFWEKVEKTDTCWNWIGGHYTSGYGCISIDNKSHFAHVVSYKLSGNVIPAGYQVDHLCFNRSCVRSDHLEAVTPQENHRRMREHQELQTHCNKGHLFDEQNTRYYKRSDTSTSRVCRICEIANYRKSLDAYDL